MSERQRGFWRAAALVIAVALLSPLSFSLASPIALVGIPAGVYLVSFQWRRPASLLLGGAALTVLLAGAAGSPPRMWYVERAWALLIGGGFAVATALWPHRTLFARAGTGVLLGAAVVALLGVLRPGLLADLDWRIAGQFDQTLALVELDEEARTWLVQAVRTGADVAKFLHPALLALASVGALCVAAWVAGRMAGVEGVLAPLRRFRFSDHLVWLFVAGLILFVLPVGDWAPRAGGNLMAFMGGLYALRGAGVLAWLGATVITSTWGVVIWVVAAVIFYPVTLGVALVTGLGDTWLDLRSRLGVETFRE